MFPVMCVSLCVNACSQGMLKINRQRLNFKNIVMKGALPTPPNTLAPLNTPSGPSRHFLKQLWILSGERLYEV